MARKGQNPKGSFKPWRPVFAWSGALLLAAAALAAVGSRVSEHPTVWWAAAAASAALGLMLGQNAWARLRGKMVENRARRFLRKSLEEGVRLHAEVPVPGLGDADIVVEHAGQRWAVEVKSHGAVRVEGARWFGSDRLVRPGPKPQEWRQGMGYVRQASAVAQRLRAQPVLWFPAARVSTHGTIDGVLVVTGPAPYLAHVARWPQRSALRTLWRAVSSAQAGRRDGPSAL